MATCCSLKTDFTSKQLAASVLNSLITAKLFNAVLRRTKRWKISLVALLPKAATDQDPFSWLQGVIWGKNLLRKCVFFSVRIQKKSDTLSSVSEMSQVPSVSMGFSYGWLRLTNLPIRAQGVIILSSSWRCEWLFGKWDDFAWRYKTSIDYKSMYRSSIWFNMIQIVLNCIIMSNLYFLLYSSWNLLKQNFVAEVLLERNLRSILVEEPLIWSYKVRIHIWSESRCIAFRIWNLVSSLRLM